MKVVHNREVLLTKLQPPNLPGDFVLRKKLSEYASENIERPLTLISAGAGFGKSTFAGCWLKNVRQLSCWLSIDESDNDLRTFLIHFVAAINTAVPEFGKNMQKLLHLPDMPESGILKKRLIPILMR